MSFIGRALPLTSQGLAAASAELDADPITLWSVLTVETSGRGFHADRRPVILFERHIFSRRTNQRFDDSHPDISGSPGQYGKAGHHQYVRLEAAIACDRQAALESASWGLGQIMGFNAVLAGYRDVEAMTERMMHGEDEQLLGMVRFLRNSKLHGPLASRDWAEFARRYNGPNYAANRYDAKLAAAHQRFTAAGLPDLDTRAVQLLLTYHGLDPGPVDGIAGSKTRAAIAALAARMGRSAPWETPGEVRAVLSEWRPEAPAGQADMRLVQALLHHLGHDPGEIDGKPGPRTQRAADAFLRDLRTEPTGRIDAALLASLRSAVISRIGQDVRADTRLAQALLAAKGHPAGPIDGLFGPRTSAAIASFQRACGILPTGASRVDAAFLENLISDAADR